MKIRSERKLGRSEGITNKDLRLVEKNGEEEGGGEETGNGEQEVFRKLLEFQMELGEEGKGLFKDRVMC